MMRIEHVAMWTDDIDRLASFYERYFGATVGDRYVNATKGFESRFLSFESGARLEVMRTTTLQPVRAVSGAERLGLTHVAMSVGSEERVDEPATTSVSGSIPPAPGARSRRPAPLLARRGGLGGLRKTTVSDRDLRVLGSVFLVFEIGEGLILSGAAMDLTASVPSFGAGVGLWTLPKATACP